MAFRRTWRALRRTAYPLVRARSRRRHGERHGPSTQPPELLDAGTAAHGHPAQRVRSLAAVGEAVADGERLGEPRLAAPPGAPCGWSSRSGYANETGAGAQSHPATISRQRVSSAHSRVVVELVELRVGVAVAADLHAGTPRVRAPGPSRASCPAAAGVSAPASSRWRRTAWRRSRARRARAGHAGGRPRSRRRR